MLLGKLRHAGFFRRPIVSIFHHPIRPTPGNRRALAGHDKVICLSEQLRRDMEANFTFRPGQIEMIPWGIDFGFFDARRSGTVRQGNYFVSAGKTQRDFETLARAFGGNDAELRIFCSGQSAPTVQFSNVRVSFAHPEQCDGNLSFEELTRQYESALAICVPLEIRPDQAVSMIGLTSLLDAMVFGKPVIMTRNPWLAIDVEKERIGFLVETGDIEGWRRAVHQIVADPEEANAMGRRARLLCEERYSLTRFSSDIGKVLASVAAEKKIRPPTLSFGSRRPVGAALR